LGYPYGQKAYKLLDLTINKIFVSRDVLFYEQVFPFQNVKHQSKTPLSIVTHFVPDTAIFQDPVYNFFPTSSETSYILSNDPLSSASSPAATEELHTTPSPTPFVQQPPSSSMPVVLAAPFQQPVQLRRSARIHQPPKHFQDFFCGIIHSLHLPAEQHALVTALSHIQEPTTYEQASKHPGWIQAMNKEIEALNSNNTWELVDLPLGKKAISSK